MVYKAGVRKGDVITAIGSQVVRDHEAALEVFESIKGVVRVTYMKEAEVAMKAAAKRQGDRGAKRIAAKAAVAVLTLAAVAAVVAYNVQADFKGIVDAHVLSRLGIAVTPRLARLVCLHSSRL